MKKQLTLCMVCQDDKVLLGMKKRGFGEGRWNGFGGKVDEGESIEEAAIRELDEEVGIAPKDMKKVGLLEFSFESEPKILEVHVFKVEGFVGEPVESEEMKPQWFHRDEIPFEQMWSDDKYWFPYLLDNKFFRGNFHFDRPASTEHAANIIRYELKELSSI